MHPRLRRLGHHGRVPELRGGYNVLRHGHLERDSGRDGFGHAVAVDLGAADVGEG